MNDYFEILGTQIKFADIKNYRLIQREYIYRPSYVEEEHAIAKIVRGHSCRFAGMLPYAAIVDESGHQSSLDSYKAKDFKESVGKELIQGAITTIGDRFRLKAFSSKKYHCVNQAGRHFTTYLEDIPALLMSVDGKASDVFKHDELYKKLGEPIAPAINLVYALVIKANEDYIFYGNGIQIEDINAAYQCLKEGMELYNNELAAAKEAKRFHFPSISKPTIKLPNIKRPQLQPSSAETKLTLIKKQFSDGEITEEEYKAKVNSVIEEL